MAKRSSVARFFGCCFICAAMAIPFVTLIVSVHAELTPLANSDMGSIWANAGIMIAPKNIQIFNHIDVIRYTAPPDQLAKDNGYIEFQNFEMGGHGDVARFNYDFGTVTKSGIMFLDVAEPEVARVNDWSGSAFGAGDIINRGMTLLRVPDWDQELNYTIGNILFYDPDYSTDPIDIGSFFMAPIEKPRFSYYTSPPVNGVGFDWQSNFQMTIGEIAYDYNTSLGSLEIGPTYIGERFADLPGDDPRFPASWKPNQATPVDFGEFQIGDLFGDINAGTYSNPAGMDAAESDLDGAGPLPILGYLKLNLPMKGSIRLENASLNGVDFGPCAIDGLQIHRLDIRLIPW